MPGFNPEKINIHDLAVEEPEKESEIFFDLERELSREDWKKIRAYIAEQRKILEDYNYDGKRECPPDIAELSFMKAIGEEIVLSEIEIENIEKRRHYLAKDIGDPRRSQFSEPLLRGILCHEKILGINTEPTKKEIDDIKEKSHFFIDVVNTLQALSENKIIGLNVSDISPEHLEKIRSQIRAGEGCFGFGDIRSPIGMIRNLRILGEYIDISPEHWKEIRELFDHIKKEMDLNKPHTMQSMIYYLYTLSILAADEIKIPEGGGLELVDHKKIDLQEKAPEMPELRNF